jgi:hypothetical protein
MTIIMNKSIIITILVIILLLAVLCLKISLVEYFSDGFNSLVNNLKDKFGVEINLDKIENSPCAEDLETVKNDKAVITFAESIINNDIANLSTTNLTNFPKSVLDLQMCIYENNIEM